MVTVVTLCGCTGRIIEESPFCPFWTTMSGADKNRKNDLGRVFGDVLKMPGVMPGKRDITWPIFVPFMSLSSGPA